MHRRSRRLQSGRSGVRGCGTVGTFRLLLLDGGSGGGTSLLSLCVYRHCRFSHSSLAVFDSVTTTTIRRVSCRLGLANDDMALLWLQRPQQHFQLLVMMLLMATLYSFYSSSAGAAAAAVAFHPVMGIAVVAIIL
ncbi:unnamed protein product, partial [Ectocarpus sp. 12 AP-2014]